MRLAKKGELLTHNKDRSVLTVMKMENVVETDFVSVRPDMDLADMVKAISSSHRNMFPVIDTEGTLARHCAVGRHPQHHFPPGALPSLHRESVYDLASGPPARHG